MEFSALGARNGADEDIDDNVPDAEFPPVGADKGPSDPPGPVEDSAAKQLAAMIAQASGQETVDVAEIRRAEESSVTVVVLRGGEEFRVEAGPENHVSVTGPDGVAKLILPPEAEAEGEASASAELAVDALAQGTPAEAPLEPTQEGQESDSSEEESKPGAPRDLSTLEALLRLSAGHVAVQDVDVPKVKPEPSISAFSSLPDVDPSLKIDDLAREWDSDSELSVASDSLRRDLSAAAEESAARFGNAQNVAGQAPMEQAQVVAGKGGGGMVAQGQAQGGLGDLLGRAIGSAVTAPFVALTSAAQHIRDNFPRPNSMAPSSAQGGDRAPLPLPNTLERITKWKCERIEKAAAGVHAAADALKACEGFEVWDDALRSKAESMGISVAEAAARMPTDPEFREVKDLMDTVWKNNPNEVHAYRTASDEFERNIRNVVPEFPNSDEETRNRVTAAMKGVEKKSEGLPGFGEDIGEYLRSLAERVREMAKTIADFMQGLARKMGGMTRTSDMTLG